MNAFTIAGGILIAIVVLVVVQIAAVALFTSAGPPAIA